MKRIILLLSFFLAIAVAAAGYWFAEGMSLRPADAQDAATRQHRPETAIPVVLAQAKRMTLPVSFSTIGTIQPVASIAVTAQVSGTVSRVAVADGAQVKQGDVLIELDARLIDTQIAQAEATVAKDEANIAKAQRDLGRINHLLASKVETLENAADAQTTLDLAKATLAFDQAGLNNLRIQWEYYTIHAPVTGRIGTAITTHSVWGARPEAAPDDVLTMAPPPDFSISGISCFMQRKTPRRSISMIRFHSSSS